MKRAAIVIDHSDDEFESLAPKKKKERKPTQAELSAEKFVWTVGKLIDIFKKCRSTDRDICRKKLAGRCDVESQEDLKTLDFVDYNYQVERYYKTATSQYRHQILQLTFFDLVRISRDYVIENEHLYIDAESCRHLLFNWFYTNGIIPINFIRDLYGVLSGETGKHNTMYVQGAPNAGKTFLFSLPIETIMTTVGRIVTINTGDRFVFENCVNQRLISIEECAIPPQHIEEMKKLMGGEHLQIDIKNQREGGAITKTPVICSSNSDPWALCMGQETAIRARMYYYQANRTYDFLSNYVGKIFNPVVWCDILLEYMKTKKIVKNFIDRKDIMLG